MAKVTYRPTPIYQRVGTLTLNSFRQRWTSTLALWGVGAGTAAVFFLSTTPVVRNGLLIKVPLLGRLYEDQTPASDKPF